MSDLGLKLKDRCCVNEDGEGSRFVGIKTDSDNSIVYFPIGYHLPESEEDVRQDIMQLISVLSAFSEMNMPISENSQTANFPIDSCMHIIGYYWSHGYYMETGGASKRSSSSLRKHMVFFQEDGSPLPAPYGTRGTSLNDKNLITKINEYCVYMSFKRIGWLYSKKCPDNPQIEANHEKFLVVLRNRLASERVEKTKELFKDMIKLIDHLNKHANDSSYYFGTYRFEYVWEQLIDSIFGINEKGEYFPRTRWILSHGDQRNSYPRESGSIMLHDGKIYVLDASYCQYGITGIPKDLPESDSINRQITYGQYIHKHAKFRQKYGDNVPVFNAFLMPYDCKKNKFGTQKVFESIGEATDDWRHDKFPYQHVQGILVDIKTLLYFFGSQHKSKIMELAETIDKSLQKNGDTLTASPALELYA